MTLFEKIKSMDIDELVEWFAQFDYRHGNAIWLNWFDENYCQKCEPIMGKYTDSDKEMEFGWCELNHKCKYFQDLDSIPSDEQMVRMWLESEGEI